MTSSTTIQVVSVSKLDWPSSESGLSKIKVQCGTLCYQYYHARKKDQIPIDFHSQYKQDNHDPSTPSATSTNGHSKHEKNGSESKKKAAINLKTLSPKQLEKLSYYNILGGIEMHSTQEQIKRAFHKACLKYHPDKEESESNKVNNATSSSESSEDDDDDDSSNPETEKGAKKKKGEDPVFLKVKEAFETLSDPKLRKSYDSTVDFDESIPSSADIASERDFYIVFGSCFDRNLRFAAENEPGLKSSNGNMNSGNGSSSAKKKKKKKKNQDASLSSSSSTKSNRPSVGNAKTSIDDVHRFYDYWVNFDSWRDFTLSATKETEHDTDMAECRYEKRWMEKEITRKAKAMKRDEMARITKLVDRAMALDPRLIREKKRVEEEKVEKERLKEEKREREERERKEREAREEKERIEREGTEKVERAKLKLQKEQGKKILRKAKQSLRKAVLAGYETECEKGMKTWDTFEGMNDDLEFLCSWLSAEELREVTEEITTLMDGEGGKLTTIREKATELRRGAATKSKEDLEKRETLRQAAAQKEAELKAARAPKQWSKEELSALAKAVKKYPPGGSNRWDAIALYINNLCKQDDPRKKEECIEKYNAIAAAGTKPTTSSTTDESIVNNAHSKEEKENSVLSWTEEQDRQLQEGLAKWPASVEKNKRWTAIANCVDGKGKKECVQRYKAIREALKKK